MKSPKPVTTFGAKGRAPTGVPRSQQIGKCKVCGMFRRLDDLDNSICIGKCREVAPETVVEIATTELTECTTCGEWVEDGHKCGGLE